MTNTDETNVLENSISQAQNGLGKTLSATGLQGNKRSEWIGETSTLLTADGEEILASSAKKMTKEVEPPFVKLYIDTVTQFLEVSAGPKGLMEALVKFMTYDGTVFINPAMKREISSMLGIKEGSIRSYLTELTNKGCLIRKDRGHYLIHPALFGRGNWEEIKRLRTEVFNEAIAVIRFNIDSNGDGEKKLQFLTKEQAKEAIKLLGADEEAINRMVKAGETLPPDNVVKIA